ncbi:ClpP/crotonase-like domain-containing protein [Amylocystis lapponica]|nr:ClpP/crotonase-like domain-containing protein [Amylocystis lapponica]
MSYPLSLPATQPLVTLTQPTPHTWLIELHNGEDSRLTHVLIEQGLKPALDAVEKHWRDGFREAHAKKDKDGGKGALIIVGKRGQNKFFSNGLDLATVHADPVLFHNFIPYMLNTLLQRLLSFPIPTIAAINGHCFAGAMMLSLCCDYRIMTDGSSRNAWLCMNEVHFGASWPYSFAAVLRAKVGDGRLHRKVALEGYRFSPPEALEAGLVDHLVKGDTEAVIAKAQEVADSVNGAARLGVWGAIKMELYRDTLEKMGRDVLVKTAAAEDAMAKARL